MVRINVGSVSQLAKCIVSQLAKCIVVMPIAALACGDCPPTPKAEATSPSGEYIARSYSFDCGPVVPFNERVGLKRRADSQFDEVAAILEVPYSASFNWTGTNTLQIIIDCRVTTASGCIPAAGRNITIRTRKRWKDVGLEYLVGPRLRSFGAGDILERLGSSYGF